MTTPWEIKKQNGFSLKGKYTYNPMQRIGGIRNKKRPERAAYNKPNGNALGKTK
jgi:hypothetical protein